MNLLGDFSNLLVVTEFLLPCLDYIRSHVSLHYVLVEVTGKHPLLGIRFPELQDLVLLSRLHILVGVTLLRLLDIELSPMPQVLCFLDLSDLECFVSNNLLV